MFHVPFQSVGKILITLIGTYHVWTRLCEVGNPIRESHYSSSWSIVFPYALNPNSAAARTGRPACRAHARRATARPPRA